MKAMYPNTTFEEKLEGDSIILNISGTDGVEGNYEFKKDSDYLSVTYGNEDYTAYSFVMFMAKAVYKQLGMEPALVNGYTAGFEAFDVDNKYFVTENDEAAAKTTNKVYIAGKYDMKELDTMYINDKALEYTDALNDEFRNGVVNCGKIRMIYYSDKNHVDIVLSEYGSRGDLTYQSMVNTVKKLQPTNADVFEKNYTELKETDADGIKVTYGLSDELKTEHELTEEEGYEYTVLHIGK
ncbi:MAG: hypothetical protein J5964_00170 [Eubacterium sp.]|nr:hypothetical protein [Eubacterium sp.]